MVWRERVIFSRYLPTVCIFCLKSLWFTTFVGVRVNCEEYKCRCHQFPRFSLNLSWRALQSLNIVLMDTGSWWMIKFWKAGVAVFVSEWSGKCALPLTQSRRNTTTSLLFLYAMICVSNLDDSSLTSDSSLPMLLNHIVGGKVNSFYSQICVCFILGWS